MKKIRIGTRGSQLALYQANLTLEKLSEKFPDIEFSKIIIKTEGDRDQSSSLTRIGGQGVFTKAIENALLNNEIDIAVHSLKDLPSQMDGGLLLAAVHPRGPVQDVLVSSSGVDLQHLPVNASIATGSIRRRSQLLSIRPDLTMSDLRGNIDTRLKKLHEQNLDGIIMAKAAILRLELKDVKFAEFSIQEMIPAVGQGAIGLQIRVDDIETKKILNEINDIDTFIAITAERAFLHRLDSGCQFPVGAVATLEGEEIILRGVVASEDGSKILRKEARGNTGDADKMGAELAEAFLKAGAGDILGALSN